MGNDRHGTYFKKKKYEGEYHKNDRTIRHGKGRLIWGDEIYDGEWADNKKEGYGVLTKADIPIYKGDWKNDVYHGNGELTKEYFGVYTGEFSEGIRNGKGRESFADGSSYDGEYLNDKFHGKGIFKTDDQVKYSYEGHFEKGLRHGEGKESFRDGAHFEGMFVEGTRNGYGELNNKENYYYRGQWQNGVKQGYGVEVNTPSEDKTEGEQPETFLYEGEFWNGHRDGIGKVFSKEGNYYYGGWERGEKTGLGVTFLEKDRKWDISVWKGDKREKRLMTGAGFPMGIHSGYHQYILNMVQTDDANRMYKDTDIKQNLSRANSHYLLRDSKLLEDREIQLEGMRWLDLQVIITNMYFSDTILDVHGEEIYPNVALGKLYDVQAISFLMALLKEKQILKDVINIYSSEDHGFYCLNMYMTNNGILQKYPVAVDGNVPITEEGFNLFSQLETSKNSILSILEKVWVKYVHLHSLETKDRFLIPDLVLAFTGSGTKKMDLTKKTTPSEVKEYMVPDSLSFAYLNLESAEKYGIDPYTPYTIKDIIPVSKGGIVVLETAERSFNFKGNNYKQEHLEGLRHLKKYNFLVNQDPNDEKRLCFMVMSFDQFKTDFDRVYLSSHDTNKRTNRYTHICDVPSAGLQMCEYYFKFEVFINCPIDISIVQHHILKGNAPKDAQKNFPTRVILGRTSLTHARYDTKLVQELKEEFKNQKLVEIFTDNLQEENLKKDKSYIEAKEVLENATANKIKAQRKVKKSIICNLLVRKWYIRGMIITR